MTRLAALARKYARTIMKHYSVMEQERLQMDRLLAMADFLHLHRHRFFNATRPVYDLVLRNFDLDIHYMTRLLDLLEQHQRLKLLPEVARALVTEYQRHHLYEYCNVLSAQELTKEQRATLKETLEKGVGKKIYCAYAIDPSLIAGIRVRGQTFFWEDSIAQRLRVLKQIGRAE